MRDVQLWFMRGRCTGLMDSPLVIAHRGWHLPGHAENSVAAVVAAFELGCDAVEVDVRRTADGQLALVHDATHHGRAVPQSCLAELGAADLCDALEVALAHGRSLFVDVKEPADEVFWGLLHDQLDLLNPHERALVVVQTSNPLAACGVELDLPGVRVSLLSRHPFTGAPAVAHWATSRMHRGLVASRVRRDQRNGHRALAWTVNKPERMKALLAFGLDGLITDRPDLLQQIVAGSPRLGHEGDQADSQQRASTEQERTDHEQAVTG